MESPLTIGQSFSHYKILSHLGAGGMGDVWLARDTTLDRRVALKILPERFTRDAQLVRRFVQEARAASALNHPNIITIYEIGQFGATHFIATEYVEGRTLRDALNAAPLSLDTAIDVAVQIASALAAAHTAGIIHRDIKPENVMLRPDGLVKVLDFGLAKLTGQRPPDAGGESGEIDTEAPTALKLYTGPHSILGTTSYMSPEQARGEELDGRSDCFSLGIVLYEMLARRRPFNGRTQIEILAAILEREPEPLAQRAPDLPYELRRIVSIALSKVPAARYESAQELAAALKEFRTERELSIRSNRFAVHTVETEPLQTVRMAPVVSQQMTQPISVAASATPVIAPQPTRRTNARWLRLALPALLLLAAGIWWLSARRAVSVPPAALKTVEIANWRSAPGEDENSGSLSPDGKLVAYAVADADGKNLWIKPSGQAGAGQASQLTRDKFINDHPVWSPDGDQLAFASARGEQNGLWRVSAPFGGGLTLIKSLGDDAARPLRWAKSGRLYYEVNRQLCALDLPQSKTTQLLRAQNAKPGSISVAPDERHAAWIVDQPGGQHELFIAPLPDGAPTRLVSLPSEIENTVWSADSGRLLYSANSDGVYQIFAASLTGADAPTQLTFGEQNSFVLDASQTTAQGGGQGSRILVGSAREESDLWAVDVGSGEERTLSAESGFEMWPDVAPDGRAVAFQLIQNMSQGSKLMLGAIHIAPIQAEPATQTSQPLLEGGFLPKWSPAGTEVAFLRMRDKTINLWKVNAAGGAEQQLTHGALATVEYNLLPYHRQQVSSFAWSPDGSGIAYLWRGPAGRSASEQRRSIHLVRADGALNGSPNGSLSTSNDTPLLPEQDPNVRLYAPLWSGDGRWLAYSAKRLQATPDGGAQFTLGLIDVAAGTNRVLFTARSFIRLLGWAEGDRALLVAADQNPVGVAAVTSVVVFKVAVTDGARQEVAVLPSTYLYNVHLAADGRALAFTARRDSKDNVWLLPLAKNAAPRKLTANSDAGLYISALAWSPDGRAIYFGKQSRRSLLALITGWQ